MKHFKIPFKLRVDNGGVYGFLEGEISSLGESEKEAIENLRKHFKVELSSLGKPRLIKEFN